MSTTLISVAHARESVLEVISPLDPETVAIDDALGRVLAEDVRAAEDVPPFPCSAMDGYAILAGDSGRRLTIVGESRAGTPAGQAVGEGEAIRVSTGAAIPAGATAVIPRRRSTARATRSRPAPPARPVSTSAAPARTCAPERCSSPPARA